MSGINLLNNLVRDGAILDAMPVFFSILTKIPSWPFAKNQLMSVLAKWREADPRAHIIVDESRVILYNL